MDNTVTLSPWREEARPVGGLPAAAAAAVAAVAAAVFVYTSTSPAACVCARIQDPLISVMCCGEMGVGPDADRWGITAGCASSLLQSWKRKIVVSDAHSRTVHWRMRVPANPDSC